MRCNFPTLFIAFDFVSFFFCNFGTALIESCDISDFYNMYNKVLKNT
jgi:hypothetical protein